MATIATPSSPAFSATSSTVWAIDPAHTGVEFAVRHLMISSVKGRFTTVAGTVVGADGNPSGAAVDITIDPASIDTREAQRDAHLRSADFLDVEKFPTLTFKSRRTFDVNGDTFKLAGDLTIHGVTREVVLDVESQGRTQDPWGNERSGFSAATRIKRSDYGLVWNQALETGGVVVGDEIKILIEAELIKQKA
jgi:polyisoprenoid-binding protein YceI